jgi:glycosyltransferase involved in cell wall biosynthesis
MSRVTPEVSIITATYNRSNVLAYAIKSVLWSTFTDWELLVVGDACTDDTEQVVASFRDHRICFINLEHNTGDQSGPNNEGFRQSRGRYIAYLHHDDLWFPDHLETAVRGIEESGADLVFTLICSVASTGIKNLKGLTPTGRYEPHIDLPPSCWLLRRELIEENGPWRFYRECYNVPSQEWLFRAWKLGKEMRLIPKMTVLAIPANYRKGAYADREVNENQLYYERIAKEPDFRERELTEGFLSYAGRYSGLEVVRWFRRGVYNFFLRCCLELGLHPFSVIFFMRSPRKGGLIDRRRKNWKLD